MSITAIPFSTMKTRVALNVGNMQSSDPWYSYLGDFINEASNRVVLTAVSKDRRAGNCFPSLKTGRWYDVTVNNQGYLTLPTTLLALDSVTCTRSTSAYNPSSSTEYPVIETDTAKFSLFPKDATGWPAQWVRSGTQILIWPTPTTDYLSQIVVRGMRREADLSNNADVLTMDPMWHPTVIKCATALVMEARGWDDQAPIWWGAVDRDVTSTLNLLGLERLRDNSRVTIAGAP
jgi:hypothetical protein